MKAVHSSDPRKKAFMLALKAQSGGCRVTEVKEDDTHVYGHCMILEYTGGQKNYRSLGIAKVPKKEALNEVS